MLGYRPSLHRLVIAGALLIAAWPGTAATQTRFGVCWLREYHGDHNNPRFTYYWTAVQVLPVNPPAELEPAFRAYLARAYPSARLQPNVFTCPISYEASQAEAERWLTRELVVKPLQRGVRTGWVLGRESLATTPVERPTTSSRPPSRSEPVPSQRSIVGTEAQRDRQRRADALTDQIHAELSAERARAATIKAQARAALAARRAECAARGLTVCPMPTKIQ